MFGMHHLFSLLILLASCFLLFPSVAYAQSVPTFSRDDCMFELPAGALEGENVECGWLTVPEEHANPNGPTIRLAVAIIKSADPKPAPDPLVMLQGGPGGSAIDTFMSVLFPLSGNSPLRRNRDIVLFEQRGTLYSEPALTCPEILKLTEDTIERRLTVTEANRLALEAYNDCLRRLEDEGVNIAAFDSVENANDIEALRVALGYDQINLYGVSYGTLLALHAMRQNPDGLRAVILNSVAPPDLNFIPEVPRTMQRAFDELFRACADDTECNRAYPNLEEEFYKLVNRLNQEPIQIPITDLETGAKYDALLDGNGLINLTFQLMYATEAIPALPKMITDLRDTGRSELLRVFWPLLAFDRTFAGGMYNATICAEDSDFTAADFNLDGVREEVRAANEGSAEYFAALCRAWNVPALPASVDEPVVSDIPTLIINGRFDPITPPAFGERAARTLSRSFVVTIPTGGHGAALTGECAADILYAFLDNPTAQPDTGCLADAVTFYTPRTIVMTPVLWRWLTDPGPLDFAIWAVLALSVFFLLTPLTVYPLSFLIRQLGQKNAQPQPVRERLGRWFARALMILSGVLAAVFILSVLAFAFRTLLDSQFLLIHGLPRTAVPLFIIPPLLIVFSVVLLVCAVLAWRDRGWGIPGRLYFALLTLALIAYLAALAPLGWLWIWT